MMSDWKTIKDAAALWGMSRRQVRYRITIGVLPHKVTQGIMMVDVAAYDPKSEKKATVWERINDLETRVEALENA